METAITKKYLTPQEMADLLRVHKATVLLWARSGIVPAVRPAHRVIRFDAEAVYAALEKRQ